jgi:hypothetical protein
MGRWGLWSNETGGLKQGGFKLVEPEDGDISGIQPI